MSERHVHEVHVYPTSFGTVRASVTLPSPEGDTYEHKLDGFCWCQPLLEEVPPEGRLFIHRRSLDSPHIEVEQ